MGKGSWKQEEESKFFCNFVRTSWSHKTIILIRSHKAKNLAFGNLHLGVKIEELIIWPVKLCFFNKNVNNRPIFLGKDQKAPRAPCHVTVPATKLSGVGCVKMSHNHNSGPGCGATRPLPRDEGAEEFPGDPTVEPRPKVWTRGQKWKKWCQFQPLLQPTTQTLVSVISKNPSHHFHHLIQFLGSLHWVSEKF